MSELLIVGGGASGLFCALAARRAGLRGEITVLERLDRVGKKLLSTGNGRCNLGNTGVCPARYHSAAPELLAEFLQDMPAALLLGFWEKQGLLCTAEEASGRIYPATYQASTVVDTLLLALKREEIRVECGVHVTAAGYAKGRFTVTDGAGRRYTAPRLVLAAGGKAAPALGTDGGGLSLAALFGHTVLPPYPCLVPLRCKGEGLAALKGVRARGGAALYRGGELLGQSRGELQFTEYGLSGIPAMELSCLLGAGQRAGACRVEVDLFPALPEGKVGRLLAARCRRYPGEPLENLFTGLLHKRLAAAICKGCGVGPLSRKCGELSEKELHALARTGKAWSFPVSGPLGWDKAQTTGGGVPLWEVERATMASRLQKGLYLTGELLDAAGDCGGYNLHWAWCTGILAGRAAARIS